ncbi:uncharacterized protein [Narcine bancroftii]|uniref:uncharacterized protein isoform X1 n=1 Tax=Narcine bancroftii TaxID=1343680 RepID=UPI0038320656
MAREAIVRRWRVRSGSATDGRSGIRGFVMRALLAGSLVALAETWDVTIFNGPKDVLLNTSISLECKITGFNTPVLDLKNVGIQWLFGPHRQEIYVVNAGRHSSSRAGTEVFETLLQKGDVSLHLTNVQLKDEGEYTCVVFITPEKVERSSKLLVLAQPAVHLSTERVTIQDGEEKSVFCEASRFYPQLHEMFWQIISKGVTKKVKTDVLLGAAILNRDGTFNVSSGLRIKPTLDDDGNLYRCTVRHQSFSGTRSKDVELTVAEPSKSSKGPLIAVIIVAFLVLLAACLFFYYYMKLRKVAPEITGCEDRKIMKHLEEEVVTWNISSFRPCEIIIWLYVKRKEKHAKSPIFNWSAKNRTEKANGLKVKGDHENVKLLVNSDWKDESFKPLDPEFETNSEGISRVKISVKIYPDVITDDEAELIIEVQHQALKQPITKSLTLDVKGVPPKVLNILVPPHVNHNEFVALACTITGFKPSPLSIIWQQKRKNSDLEEIVRLERDNRTIFFSGTREKYNEKHYICEAQHDDKTWSKTSVLVIVPDINQDQDSQYLCQIQHPCTNSKQEQEIMLKIAATPKLGTIKCSSEKIILNVPMTLSCSIFGFYPKEILVTWLKNGKNMDECPTDKKIIEQDGLYDLTSNLKVVPTNSTLKYTCQVEHVSLSKPIKTDWVPGKMSSLPTLTAIEANPPCPELGHPLILSCKASGFYPETNQVLWFKEFDKITDGIETGRNVLDTASGLYSRSSQWRFKPTVNDHGKEYKMQFLHFETSNKPLTASYVLKLKGIPYVEDIKWKPQKAMYGTELALTCEVNNFIPRDIRTQWQRGKIPITKGVEIDGPKMNQNQCFQLVSCLYVKTTALDFDEDISFCVSHSKLSEIIIKKASLKLQALAPDMSDITSNPKILKVNQNAEFSVSLTHYVPDKLQIKWFKNEKLYEDVVKSPPKIADDGLFSSVTSLTFMTTENDHENIIKCEVFHEKTKRRQEKLFKLLFEDGGEIKPVASFDSKGTVEVVSNVTCQTKNPKVGRPVTLSCDVYGHFAEDAHIIWYRAAYPFDERKFVTNTPFKNNKGFTTALTYTPKEKDNSIQVFIDIDMSEHIRSYNLQLH